MAHETPETLAAPTSGPVLGKFGPAGLLVGVIGMIAYWGAFFAMPDKQEIIAKSYMYGWMVWMTMTLGCLGLTLLHHTVRGSWGLAILRFIEAGGSVGSFVVMYIAYLPIMLFPGKVYPWVNPGTDKVLLQKQALYNPGTFLIMNTVLFIIWGAFAHFLRKSSIRQDENKNPNEAQGRTNWSAPGMVIYGLTVTLGATNWIMSMDKHWYSTMFGPIVMINGALAVLAAGTYLACANRDKAPFSQIVKPDLTKDLGNLLLTTTLLWAYFNFSQFVIIWNGNLPATAKYYAERSPNGFNVIGFLIIVGSFVVPFVSLLAPRVKRYPNLLMRVAGWIFFFRFVDNYYIIAPLYSTSMIPTWEIFSLLAVGGLWVAQYGQAVKSAGLYPTHDMRLMEAPGHAA